MTWLGRDNGPPMIPAVIVKIVLASLGSCLPFLPNVALANCGATNNITLTNVAFGTYTGTLVDNSAGTIAINCSSGLAYQIGIGTGYSGNTAARTLHNGSVTLNYYLYQASTYAINWGDNSGVDTEGGTGTGTTQSYTIYAQIPALQYPTPGTYVDSMIAYIAGQNVYSTLQLSATVQATCTIAASNLNFGTYTGVAMTTSTTLTVTCTNTTPYQIGNNGGRNSSGGYTWNMTGPSSSTLPYYLYTNSGENQYWGNTENVDTIKGTGTGAAQTINVYGSIPAGKYVTPGSYSDTVTATVYY